MEITRHRENRLWLQIKTMRWTKRETSELVLALMFKSHRTLGKSLHSSSFLTSDDIVVSTCPVYGLSLAWIQGLHRKAMSQFWPWLMRCVNGTVGGERKQSTVFPISLDLASFAGKMLKNAIFKGWRYLVIMFSEEGKARGGRGLPKPQGFKTTVHITSKSPNELCAGLSKLNYIIHFRFISWITTWDTMFLGCSWYISEITEDFKKKNLFY